MDFQVQGRVGLPQPSADNTPGIIRLARFLELVTTDGKGRFAESNRLGRMYQFGIADTALVAANAIATGLTATAKPIVGLYNPLNSGKNMIILQATVIISTIAGTAVAPGGFYWVSSANNTGVSTGSAPINCLTQQAAGSVGKAFAMSTALTGLTNNLVLGRASSIAPINAAGPATAIHQAQGNTQDNVDGSIIVPPGGVVALMNQISTTTLNLGVGILWEEYET